MIVRDAFRVQAEACTALGSPFTARLCSLLAERLEPGAPVADRILGWHGDPSGEGDALPLRLAGALHALVLSGSDADLARTYPPNEAEDDALWTAVAAAIAAHAAFILARIQGPPQTNEVQRSAALAPGFLTVAARTGLPLAVSEIGASAGLNLIWDRYAYAFGPARWGDLASAIHLAPEWRGSSPPLPPAVVAERAGCDIAPVHVANPEAEVLLLSYIWPDQTARLARTRTALGIARAARFELERADAADWLARRLATPRRGHAHTVVHSIMWQYMPAATRARIAALIASAGGRASRDAPVAWLRLEPDDARPGVALTLTLWPGGDTLALGRAHFHGCWVDWHGP